MNPAPGFGNPDAYLTGDLHRQLRVEIRGDKAVFDSLSPHTPFMVKRDGPAIFGHTDDSKRKFGGIILPHVVQEIKDKTGCK